jgi:uncharacterized protein YjiS (DUF1127 family)
MIDISETIGATLRILVESYGQLPIWRSAAACLPHCSDIVTLWRRCSRRRRELLKIDHRMLEDVSFTKADARHPVRDGSPTLDAAVGHRGRDFVKRWSAVINHSRASGKPPLTAEFNAPDALQTYLEPGNDVVSITIYRCADCCAVPARHVLPASDQ